MGFKKILARVLIVAGCATGTALQAQTYPLTDAPADESYNQPAANDVGKSGAMTTCTMKFKMSGFSLIYKRYDGLGEIHCRNGERAQVALTSNSIGFTIGKSEIEGDAVFSEVRNINEIFGDFVSMESHAGFINSFDAQLLTRGEISLALKGRGRGLDIGATIGDLNIKRR